MSSSSPPRVKEVPAKIVVLGESAVGKSSVALRFVRREFVPNQEATIGAAFLSRSVTLSNGTVLKFEIWDTAGQERYRALAPMYYRGAAGALVVYDITNAESLRKALNWVAELRNNADPQTVVMLVGNKCDLEQLRQVSTVEGEKASAAQGLQFFEASAKDGQNVDTVFSALGEALVARGFSTEKNFTAGQTRSLDPPGARVRKTEEKKKCSC